MCLIVDISIPSAAIFIFLRCLFPSKSASVIQHWPVCFPTNSPFTLNNLLNVSNFQSPWIFLSRFRLFSLHLMLLHKTSFQNSTTSISSSQAGDPPDPPSGASRADNDTLPEFFEKPLSSCISRFPEIFWSAAIKTFVGVLCTHSPPTPELSKLCSWNKKLKSLNCFSLLHRSLISIYSVDPQNPSPVSVIISLGRSHLLIFWGILLCAAARLKLAPRLHLLRLRICFSVNTSTTLMASWVSTTDGWQHN